MSECQKCEQMDQCARCGSSIGWEDCPTCAACMRSHDPDPHCPACGGSGASNFCLSSAEWCEANPLPGHENIPRHTVEWFTVPCPDCVEGITRG